MGPVVKLCELPLARQSHGETFEAAFAAVAAGARCVSAWKIDPVLRGIGV